MLKKLELRAVGGVQTVTICLKLNRVGRPPFYILKSIFLRVFHLC